MSDRRSDERRSQPERRLGVERRRQADNRYAAIEVCRSTLHLAILIRGDATEPDRVVTRSICWRHDSASLNTEEGVRELQAAFHTLVTEERLAGATARIALNGEFCVTRVVTGSSEQVRHELSELEDRSNHYLLLGTGPKTIARCNEQLDARHEHALLSVANQTTLQLLVDIAESAGMKLDVIEPSLVALSRAQARLPGGGDDACLIVQLDEGEVELGVCHRGRLLLEYRPGGKPDADNIADVVAQHLGRVQRYLARQHSYLKEPLSRVYLTGEPTAVRRAHNRFTQFQQFEVHLLDPGQLEVEWEHATDTPGTEFAAALGMALSYYPANSQQASPNLIEHMLATSRQPLRPFLIRSAIPLAATLLVAIGLALMWVQQRAATSVLRKELAGYEPARVHATELRLELVRTEAKMAQLQRLENLLPRPRWGTLMQHIAQSMPDDVWLDRLGIQDGRDATLTGSSYTDGGVYDFANYLKKVPQIAQIDLQGTGVGHTPNGPTTNFNMELSLARSAGSDKQGGSQ